MSTTTTVEWPSFCDLCEEYTTTPERCSHCGQHLHPIERPEVPLRPGPGLEPSPLGQAATELRHSHRATAGRARRMGAGARTVGRPGRGRGPADMSGRAAGGPSERQDGW